MNDESPFRISTLLLTVACLVCGISTAVLFVPQYGQQLKLVDYSKSAGELQLNLAEFHSSQPNARPEHALTLPPARRKLVPVSSAIPLKKSNEPPVTSPPLPESHSLSPSDASKTTASNLIESTVVGRNATQGTSPAGSVPQFYAPVTVHPVTVNIDNSGVIREISRVNERLDSLSAENSRFEKDMIARIGQSHSASSPIDASGMAAETHHEVPRETIVSQDQVHTNADMASSTPSASRTTRVSTRVPSPSDEVPFPFENSIPELPRGTIEQSKSDDNTADLTEVQSPAVQFQPIAEQVAEKVPDILTPVDVLQEKLVKPIPEKQNENEFGEKPKTAVPDVPSFEMPSTESEFSAPQDSPALEFSTQVLAVPSEVPAVPEVASSVEFDAEPIAIAESEPQFQPGFETATAREIVATDMKESMPQVAEFPVLPDLTAPGLQWTKRTTDPPFMNRLLANRPTPRAATANSSAPKVHEVLHASEAKKQSGPQSKPAVRNADNSKTKSVNKAKAVTQPSPLQRLRSLFK